MYILVRDGIKEGVVLQIKDLVNAVGVETTSAHRSNEKESREREVQANPSWAEYVNTFPLTSSNSTKPGHFRDSVSKRENPASS